jgi:hypothetical protein
VAAGGDLRGHVGKPSLQEGRNCYPRRINVRAPFRLGYEAGALNLCLSLSTPEAMPTALALSGGRIAHVDDDGPMAGRAFAKMPLHFESSTISSRSGVSGPIVVRSMMSSSCAC